MLVVTLRTTFHINNIYNRRFMFKMFVIFFAFCSCCTHQKFRVWLHLTRRYRFSSIKYLNVRRTFQKYLFFIFFRKILLKIRNLNNSAYGVTIEGVGFAVWGKGRKFVGPYKCWLIFHGYMIFENYLQIEKPEKQRYFLIVRLFMFFVCT